MLTGVGDVCCISYYVENCLYVSYSGLITSVGEEGGYRLLVTVWFLFFHSAWDIFLLCPSRGFHIMFKQYDETMKMAHGCEYQQCKPVYQVIDSSSSRQKQNSPTLKHYALQRFSE